MSNIFQGVLIFKTSLFQWRSFKEIINSISYIIFNYLNYLKYNFENNGNKEMIRNKFSYALTPFYFFLVSTLLQSYNEDSSKILCISWTLIDNRFLLSDARFIALPLYNRFFNYPFPFIIDSLNLRSIFVATLLCCRNMSSVYHLSYYVYLHQLTRAFFIRHLFFWK